MKSRIVLLAFLVLILLNIVVRIPVIPSEGCGTDTALMHWMGQSIIEEGAAKWIVHPASAFGLYPYSYPSSVSHLLAILASVSGVPITSVILILSFVFGSLCVITAYIFAKEFSGNELISLLTAFAYSLAPYFVKYSIWGCSSRFLFLTLLPLIFFLILRYEKTKQIKYIVMAMLILIVEMLTHRMSMMMLGIVIPAYICSKFYLFLREKYKFMQRIDLNLSRIFFILILLFFTFQFTPLYPLKENYLYLTKGMFFSGNSMFIIFLNMVVDYAALKGPLVVLISCTGIIIYLVHNRRHEFRSLFVIFTLIGFAPFIINSTYTSEIFGIILALFFGICIKYLSEFVRNHTIYRATFFSIIVLSILFTSFMATPMEASLFHKHHTSGIYADFRLAETCKFMNTLDGNILTNGWQTSFCIMSHIYKPALPFYKGPQYLVYGDSDRRISAKINPKLSFKTDYLWIPERRNPYCAFWRLAEEGLHSDFAKKSIDTFDLRYVYLKDSYAPTISKINTDKIYDNSKEGIWELEK